MATTSKAMTFDEYKAERRRQTPVGNPLDDYDPAMAARLLSVRGTPKDWHFCECRRPQCPDKDKLSGAALAPVLGRPVPPAVIDAA